MMRKLDLKLVLLEAVQYFKVGEQVGDVSVGSVQVPRQVSTKSFEEICECFFLLADPRPMVVLDLIWCDVNVDVDC